jgi:hypothetical protein
LDLPALGFDGGGLWGKMPGREGLKELLYKGRAVGGKERAEFEADRHLTDCPK